jgi:nucleoside-diphosphate-sugar epimerase
VAIIRPFNTYGPRQSARAVLAAVILQIAAGKRTLKLGSLSPTRDFNYVSDTVRGFIAIAESDTAVGQVINIGSNFEVSIGEAVEMIAELMGVDVKVETDVERLRPAQSEVERLWADNSRALQLLGWKPEFGGRDGFRRGLAETISWFAREENRSRYKADIYNL